MMEKYNTSNDGSKYCVLLGIDFFALNMRVTIAITFMRKNEGINILMSNEMYNKTN